MNDSSAEGRTGWPSTRGEDPGGRPRRGAGEAGLVPEGAEEERVRYL